MSARLAAIPKPATLCTRPSHSATLRIRAPTGAHASPLCWRRCEHLLAEGSRRTRGSSTNPPVHVTQRAIRVEANRRFALRNARLQVFRCPLMPVVASSQTQLEGIHIHAIASPREMSCVSEDRSERFRDTSSNLIVKTEHIRRFTLVPGGPQTVTIGNIYQSHCQSQLLACLLNAPFDRQISVDFAPDPVEIDSAAKLKCRCPGGNPNSGNVHERTDQLFG